MAGQTEIIRPAVQKVSERDHFVAVMMEYMKASATVSQLDNGWAVWTVVLTVCSTAVY